MATFPDHDRQNATLTQGQRRFLAGEDGIDPTSSHGRTIRTRIRRRARSALFDFQLLMKMQTDDIQQTLAPIPSDEEAPEGNIVAAMENTIAFLLTGYMADDPEPFTTGGPSVESFEDIVAMAVGSALAKHGEVAETVPEVTISVEREELTDDTDFSELSLTQLERLLVADQITPQEYAAAVNERSGDTDDEE